MLKSLFSSFSSLFYKFFHIFFKTFLIGIGGGGLLLEDLVKVLLSSSYSVYFVDTANLFNVLEVKPTMTKTTKLIRPLTYI
jgi:hypothetical protein